MARKYKRLYLTEKDTQVEDLCGVFGWNKKGKWKPVYSPKGDEVIVPLQGHLMSLLNPDEYDERFKDWNEDTVFIFPDKFKLKTNPRTAELLNNALSHIREADEIILCTDPDDEGASLGMRVIEKAKASDRILKMVDMSIPDKKSLGNSLKSNKVIPFRTMAQAGYARAYIDWAEGMSLSRALTLYLGRGSLIPFGGVKMPVVYMVTDRYLKNKNFKNIPFWNVVGNAKADSVALNWQAQEQTPGEGGKIEIKSKFMEESEAIEIKAEIEKASGLTVLSASKKKVSSNPPQLYSLAPIQAEMSKKYGYSSDQTLDTLQSLYQDLKVLSYPRTGVKHISDELKTIFIEHLESAAQVLPKGELDKLKANGLNKSKRVFDTSKCTPHHGLIPTLAPVSAVWGKMTEPQKRVYTEIAIRALEAVSAPAVGTKTEVIVEIRDGLVITASDTAETDAGWKTIRTSPDKLDENAKDNLGSVKKGDAVSISSVDLKKGESKPDPIFTEGTLLLAMENIASVYGHLPGVKEYLKDHGIGTDSTRSTTLKELTEPKNGDPLIKYDGKKIIPTEKGLLIVKKLPSALTSPVKRGKMTESIQKVRNGEITLEQFLAHYKKDLEKSITLIKDLAQDPSNWIASGKKAQDPLGLCPSCAKGQIVEGAKVFSCSEAKHKKTGEGKNVVWTNEGCDYKIFKSAMKNFGGSVLTSAKIKKMLADGSVEINLKSKNTGKSYKKHIQPDMKWGVAVKWEG